MSNRLIIEIRHAAAAKAAADGNVESVGHAPPVPPDTVKAPPAPAPSKPDRNRKPPEPKPPTAQQQMSHTWSKAEAAAMAKYRQTKK